MYPLLFIVLVVVPSVKVILGSFAEAFGNRLITFVPVPVLLRAIELVAVFPAVRTASKSLATGPAFATEIISAIRAVETTPLRSWVKLVGVRVVVLGTLCKSCEPPILPNWL